MKITRLRNNHPHSLQTESICKKYKYVMDEEYDYDIEQNDNQMIYIIAYVKDTQYNDFDYDPLMMKPLFFEKKEDAIKKIIELSGGDIWYDDIAENCASGEWNRLSIGWHLLSTELMTDDDDDDSNIHISSGQKIYIESHIVKAYGEEPLSLLYHVWDSYASVYDYVYDDLYTPDIYNDIEHTWDQPIGNETKRWTKTGKGIHIFETILN